MLYQWIKVSKVTTCLMLAPFQWMSPAMPLLCPLSCPCLSSWRVPWLSPAALLSGRVRLNRSACHFSRAAGIALSHAWSRLPSAEPAWPSLKLLKMNESVLCGNLIGIDLSIDLSGLFSISRSEAHLVTRLERAHRFQWHSSSTGQSQRGLMYGL